MKYTKDTGITLIALVITIIVLLILAGVSIMAVVGENGLIARAKEAVMLTKLADVLFDLENDLLDVKVDNLPKKLNTTEVINNLRTYHPSKYNLPMKLTAAGLSNIELQLYDSPISDLSINLTGNVYVDNYKRGKLQLSDIYEECPIEGCWYGDSTIKLNDGTVKERETVHGLYDISSPTKDENLPWINENNEIIAWSDKFSIFPTGIQDYEFASYNIASNIYWFLTSYLTNYNNKYVIFPTIKCKQINQDLFIELNVSHFYKTVYLNTKPLINGTPQTPGINMGGTYITSAGIILSESPTFDLANEHFEMFSLSTPIASTSDEKLAASKVYCSYIEDINNVLSYYDFKGSRIYYAPYVYYRKYAGTETDATGKETHLYYTTNNIFIGNTVKFIDLEK